MARPPDPRKSWPGVLSCSGIHGLLIHMNEASTTATLPIGSVVDIPAELIDIPAVPPVVRNRDSRGRFQRPPIHIARAKATGCLFYETGDGTTHSRNHCGDIRGRVRRCHSKARGWLCTTCLEVVVRRTTTPRPRRSGRPVVRGAT